MILECFSKLGRKGRRVENAVLFAASFLAFASNGVGVGVGLENVRAATLEPTTAADANVPANCVGLDFDDFDAPERWTFPIYQYGDKTTGNVQIDGGELRITRTPRGKWHSVGASRTSTVRFAPGLAVHYRFRFDRRLLGSDLYVHLNVDGRRWIELGINGEQSWRMFRRCEEKEFDDELFYGSSFLVGQAPCETFPTGKRIDVRAALGDRTAGKVRWDDWRVFSVVWDANADVELDENGDIKESVATDSGEKEAPKRADESFGRLRIFVDGDEIRYRDLDCPAPSGGVDVRFSSELGELSGETRRLEIVFSAFADGDLYADKNVCDGEGVRWLSAFASTTPAIPSPDGPEFGTPIDAVLRWDYVLTEDSTSADVAARRSFFQKLAEQGRFPKNFVERTFERDSSKNE